MAARNSATAPPRAGRVAMRVTSIRVGVDLWRVLEGEATSVGVSVSQYVREAALARASAAIAARGEDPMQVLAAGAQAADGQGPGTVAPELRRSRSAVASARSTRTDAKALRAQARQATQVSRARTAGTNTRPRSR